jgi:hypothetical protein
MKDFSQLRCVIWVFYLQHHIRTVERNDARFIPALNEGEQVNPSVAEINMHQIGTAPSEQIGEQLVFTAINDRWLALHEFQPAMAEQILAGRRDKLDILKRKPVGVLHLLRHDEGLHIPQAR